MEKLLCLSKIAEIEDWQYVSPPYITCPRGITDETGRTHRTPHQFPVDLSGDKLRVILRERECLYLLRELLHVLHRDCVGDVDEAQCIVAHSQQGKHSSPFSLTVTFCAQRGIATDGTTAMTGSSTYGEYVLVEYEQTDKAGNNDTLVETGRVYSFPDGLVEDGSNE